MDENVEGQNRCTNQTRCLPASSSPLSSPSCRSTPTWQPVESPLRPPWGNDRSVDTGMQLSPPPRFYEELFCTSQASNTLVPLASTLVTSSVPQSDVVKQGYLGKMERSHKRYFVLRAGSHTGPSRLEWYKSQEKFTALEKSAGKAVLFGSSKQGVIYLRCCLGVSRVGSSRKSHAVALYAKDQTVVLVVEDQLEQEEWYLAIKKLMEEERNDEEGFDEEDDGYCTLPPAAFFKEYYHFCISYNENTPAPSSSPLPSPSSKVWPVTVKPRGLGCSKSLTGESRLCLTATSLVLVRVGACIDLPSVTIPLLSVRRFGHLDNSFFVELGRSAPNGPGEVWMEARDQGNPSAAQHIHELVRETVKALRVLPDFSWSPTSNHSQLQTLLSSKRCRTKPKLLNVRPLGSRPVLPPRHTEIQTSPARCHLEPHKQDQPEHETALSSTSHLSPVRSHQSSTSDTNSYVEMKVDQRGKENICERVTIVTGDHCSVAACGVEGLDAGEREEEVEGPGYMMMSPQTSHSSSVLPQDDYMTMESPQKHNWTAYSSLQTSFNSSTCDGSSPLHPSHHQTNSPPHWLLTSLQQSESYTGQSQMSIGSSTRPQDDAGKTRTSSSPVRSTEGSALIIPFVTSDPVWITPIQTGLNSGSGWSGRLRPASVQPARRHRLSLCLPSCLQTKDRSECL